MEGLVVDTPQTTPFTPRRYKAHADETSLHEENEIVEESFH
jgi:hypothetical protein